MFLLSRTGQHWGYIQGHKHILQNKARCTDLVEMECRKAGKLGRMIQSDCWMGISELEKKNLC